MRRLQSPFRRAINSTIFSVPSTGRYLFSPQHLSSFRPLTSLSGKPTSFDHKNHPDPSGSGSDGSLNSNSSDSDSESSEFEDFDEDQINDGPNATKYREVAIDELGRAYGTGRRKTAIARVWIKKGIGECIVNKKNIAEYFPSGPRSHALEPFVITETAGMFDVLATVKGGGQMGQAGALRLGISRAIEAFQPGFKPLLKTYKLLTRDPRMVERKKPGFKKARKRKQWVKR